MKRIMTGAALVALLFALPAFAGQGSVQIGIKGGLNLANITMEEAQTDATYSKRMGFAGGVVLGFVASPALSFDTDFLYMQKGVRSEAEYMDGGTQAIIHFDWNTQLDYVVVAPTLRVTTRRDGFAPYLLFGGEFGYLINANAHTESHDDQGGHAMEQDSDVKEHFKETDVSVTFGGGFEFPSNSYSFFLEGRYSLGLTEIGADVEGQALSQKHRGIYMFGGLRF